MEMQKVHSVISQQDMEKLKNFKEEIIAVMKVQFDVMGDITLEANYCPIRNHYYGIHFRVGDNWNADSERWILNTFLPIAKRIKKKQDTPEDWEDLVNNGASFVTKKNAKSFVRGFKMFLKMTHYKAD